MRRAVSGQWAVDSGGQCIVLLVLPLQGRGAAEGSSQWSVDNGLFCTLHWSPIVQCTGYKAIVQWHDNCVVCRAMQGGSSEQ